MDGFLDEASPDAILFEDLIAQHLNESGFSGVPDHFDFDYDEPDSSFLDLDTEQDDDSDMEMDTESGGEEEAPEGPQALELIENMVLDFLTQVTAAHVGSVESKSENSDNENDSMPPKKKVKARPKIEIRLADRRKIDEHGEVGVRKLKFPRTCPSGSARPLAQLFNVLDIAHESLTSGVPTTKRDVFYKDVTLFKTQKTVDQLVDDLAATWELRRSDLNIRAASKGLVCGSGLTIRLFSGESTSGKDTDGINIPVGEDIESFGVDEKVKWILVVEKEAVFQTLCRLGVANHPNMPGPGLVITGKGYPDVATRHLVKSLADALPRSIPIAALVDCDPYGLDILSVYRYGSRGMQHEKESLAAKRMKWLGLRTSELSSLKIDWDTLLPISRSDEKKILAMLRRPNLPLKWKKELSRSLHLRRKAEIEIISTSGDGSGFGSNPLLGYLCSRMTEIVEVTTDFQSV